MRRAARPVMYLGVLAVVFGLALVHARYVGHYSFTGTFRFGWTIAYAALLALLAYGFGLPDVPRTRQAALGASVGAAFTGALAISLVQLFVGDALLPRFVVFGAAVLLPDWYRICIRMANGGRLRAEGRDRVVVVADPDDVAILLAELEGNPERPASIVTSLSTGEADSPDRPLEAAFDGTGASVLVLAAEAHDRPAIVSQAATLHAHGVRVRSLTLFYEEWLGKLPIAELERASMLFDIGEVHRTSYGRAKRMLDVPIALLGCVALALIVPVVWLANLATSRGPLLYRQPRVGRNGEVFTILKLRTMRPAGDETEGEWTAEGDPRVTPIGRLLRRTHLDELPQVINILRGELSIVGPRPEQPHYVADLEAKLPFYGLRHLVRPGLTGWAQVKFGYAGDATGALEKLQYDFWYLRHQSVGTDLRIVGRTIRSVFGSEGRGR